MSKIIGQDKLIKEVNRIFQVFVNSNCKIRPHFILTGESGSGKSFTIKQLCDMNELSFLEVNAAQITKEGISGNSLSKILSPLVNYSHTPIVVFVDEFDKLFINGNTNSQLANESTASVQNEFLKLLESDTTSVFGDYGAYYMLGKIFGWNTTSKDYRYPSTKVGLLYGDSITLERQKQIYLRLENAHMAACNLVLGVGSYSYQYASRDSLGFAIKATACVVNGELKEIFKHPKTDDGTKNSLKGLIAVYKCLDGKYTATDQVSIEEEKEGCLETVFEDGILKKEYSLEEIRQRIDHGL